MICELLLCALCGALLSAAVCRVVWIRRARKAAAIAPSGPPQGLTEWDKRLMACHEAGHAVCSYFLPERGKLVRISVSPSDEAFGMVRTAPRPHHNATSDSLTADLAVLLAGGVAERLFMNEITTSCIHDLASARELAGQMVDTFGMGKRSGFTLPPPGSPMGEVALNKRDADIAEILSNAENIAKELLEKHRDLVDALSEMLLRQSTMNAAEIEGFFTAARPKCGGE